MNEDVLHVPPQSHLADLRSRPSWRALVYVVGCLVVGLVGGLLWSTLTPLSSYTIREGNVASITERGQAAVVAADVVFVIITAILGLLIGIVGWAVLHRYGWLVTFLPALAALAAALVAWRMGLTVGQGGFSERLAAASVGDVVQIDLQLRAMSALVVAPFAAVTPVMLLAAFWPEPGDGQPAEQVAVEH